MSPNLQNLKCMLREQAKTKLKHNCIKVCFTEYNSFMKMEEEDAIVEVKEKLMIPLNNGGLPTLRKAHFLKPILNPTNHPLPNIPFLSLPSDSKPDKLITVKIVFKGVLNPQKSYKMWVENLQKTHHIIWKKVGIFDAIRASTYNIKLDNELIIGLAEKWCPETNTFIFSWGEVTVTLEDVMILGGFSVLGNSVKNSSKMESDQEILKKLMGSCRKIKKNANISNVSHNAWMNYFKGSDGEMEHVALVVLWLSRYVFSSSDVFSIAISLARGTRIALAPAVLASIYRDLSMLKDKIVRLKCEEGKDDGSKLVLWAPLQLVQVWAWERFPTLSPKPISLVCGEPRLARWHGVKGSRSRSLRMEIESGGDEFLWRPYVLSVRNWEFPKFCCDQEMWVLVNFETDDELLSFARCLRVSELVGMNCVEQYLPHRVAMQFGMDQDIPVPIPRLKNVRTALAWCSYDKPLDGLKFYLPPRLLEGDVTVEYANWWRTQSLFHVELSTVSKRQRRRSVKKVKKLSQIIYRSKEATCEEIPIFSSSFPCNEAAGLASSERSPNVQDIVIDLLLRLEDNEKYEPNAIQDEKEEEGKRRKTNMDEDRKYSENSHSHGEGPLVEEEFEYNAMEGDNKKGVNYTVNTLSASEGPLGNDKFEFKAIDEDKKKGVNCTDNSLSVSEGPFGKDDFELNAMEEDKNKVANERKKNDMGTCSIDETLIDDNGILSGAGAEDVQQHKAVEDKDTERMKTSLDHGIVIVSDEEESADRNAFEAICLDFETRINKLDKIVSALKEAKNRFMVG